MPLPLRHYYGDNVRRLFIAGAVIMAAGLPFFTRLIVQPVLYSVVGILILGVAAGLTSPRQPLTSVLDICIALAAVIMFERYAITYYEAVGVNFFSLVNQALAVIFVCALYFATKTLRGYSKQNKTPVS